MMRVLPIPLLALVVFLLFLKVCGQKEDLILDLKVSPISGLEPLVVDLELTAKSNQKIVSVKIDFDGDGNYDIEDKPPSKTYSLNLTHTYSVPQEHKSDDEFRVQISAKVEGKNKVVEKTQVVRVFPKKDFDFYVVANVCSGPPPLEVNFQVFPVLCDQCIFSIDCDGDGVYEFSQSTTQFTCKFLNEGLYPSKVSASDGKGNFSISPFFFCGYQSQSRISRFIEVLSKILLESVIYPPRAFKILDVFYDSGITEYIAMSSFKSIVILKDREILDVFGYDIIYSSPTFAKFFKKDDKVFMYFSSEYGTFKWTDGVTEKISDRRLLMLYPKENSYIILDQINQKYGFCSDEKAENCQEFPFEYIDFYSEVRFYDDYLMISNSLKKDLVLVRLDDFYIETVNRESYQVEVYTYDYLPPYSILIIPWALSDEFQLLRIDTRSVITYRTPDPLRIKFLSGVFLDEENLVLGTSNFPCESDRIKTCNKVIFNLKDNQFNKIEGVGEILSSIRRGRNAFLLHMNGFDVISKILQSYKVSSYYLPGDFGSFLYADKRLYIASRNILSFFDYNDGRLIFSGYVQIPQGLPVVIQKAGELIFVLISDDLSTDLNEGKLVVIKDGKVLKIVDNQISVVGCAYVRGDKIFVCDKNRIVVFLITGEKIRDITFPEYIRDIYVTDKVLYVVSDVHLFSLSQDGNVFDIKNTIMQFFGLDVDEERKLLFTAEGQDHTFRIFDISNVIPQEITRVSIDYGTYNDIAVGVSHFEKLLFLYSSYVGVMVFDVSNPLKPLIRKKTYFDDYSAPVEKCFVDKFAAVCSSLGSILFVR